LPSNWAASHTSSISFSTYSDKDKVLVECLVARNG
jgi:hypothetical protein